MSVTPRYSIIVPVLNEAAGIVRTLNAVQAWRQMGDEVILVDGGSTDDTLHLASPLVDASLEVPKGRAKQMNAGAQASRGNVLVFLHADTLLRSSARTALDEAFAANESPGWGRFDVRLSGPEWPLRVVAALMNLRSRWTGIATGDQTIFVSRELFRQVGGFPEQPLMEDIELSARLKRIRKPWCLRAKVVTSARRWQQGGILATILTMWRLRLAYWWHGNADVLAARYFDIRGK